MSTTPKYIAVYIDDDTDDIEFLSNAFNSYAQNIELVAFQNPSEGLSYLNKLAEQNIFPCLIILDINMPLMNGKELLLRLRETEEYDTVPVILFSTSNLQQDMIFAEKYNAGFITKPLQLRQMECIVDELINHCPENVKPQIRKK